MKKGTGVLLIVSVLVLCLIIVIVKSYTSLSTLNVDVTNKESDLNVQLTRKKEQVTSLINLLKDKMTFDYEKINEKLAKINDGDTKIKSENNNQLSGLLNEIFNSINQELLNNDEIKNKIKDIISTESRVDTAKNNYNKAIDDYNSKVKSFPASIIASIRGFKEKDRFEMSIKINNILEEK